MSGAKKKHRLLKALGILALAGILCYGGLIGFVTVQESGVSREVSDLRDGYDAIIILGAQVRPTGEPSVQLQWRLDKGAEAWEAHAVPIVVCGAQGKDEPMPEAVAMKRYLADRQIPEDMIYTDDTSTNTNQNLRNAGEILKALPDVRRVLIVTSDYHVPRAMALARDMGFQACGLGAPCKPEYWLKNHAREALAWCKYWGKKYLHLPLE